MNRTYGEIAYNAYCQSRDWKSVRGEPLPAYQAQSPELQQAWEAAGKAVADSCWAVADDIAITTGRG